MLPSVDCHASVIGGGGGGGFVFSEGAADVSVIVGCGVIFVRRRRCLAEAAIMTEARGGITSSIGGSGGFVFSGGCQRFLSLEVVASSLFGDGDSRNVRQRQHCLVEVISEARGGMAPSFGGDSSDGCCWRWWCFLWLSSAASCSAEAAAEVSIIRGGGVVFVWQRVRRR